MINITILDLRQHNYCEIDVLGDLHYGAHGQTRGAIRKVLRNAQANRQAGTPNYVVSIGDNLDNPQKHAEGGEMTPNDALIALSDDFRDAAFDGTFLGWIEGNHDRNLTRTLKMKCDLVKQLCHEWNAVANLGLFYSIAHILIIKLRHQKRTTSVAILFHHGFGGGRTIGTVINNLEKLLGVVSNPDIVVAGHRHVEINGATIGRYVINHQYNSLVLKEIKLVSTGSNLEDAEYALRFGLPPSIPSNTKIKITGCRYDEHRPRPIIQVEGIR